MADSYDAAKDEVNAQQRALLAAIAQAGSKGRADHEQLMAEQRAQQQATVQAALAEAARRGAPQAMLDSVRHTTSAPFDRRAADLSSAATSRQQSLDALGQSSGAYMDMAKGAIPGLRLTAQSEMAQLQAKQAQEDEMKRISLEIARMNLAKAQAGADGAGGLKAIAAQLGGVGNANRYLLDQSDDALAVRRDDLGRGGAHLLGKMFGLDVARKSTGAGASRGQFDAALGLPPGYTKGLAEERVAKPPAAKDPVAKKLGWADADVVKVRGFGSYKTAKDFAESFLDDGVTTRAAFVKTINTAKVLAKQPRVRKLIIEEYGYLFPTKV